MADDGDAVLNGPHADGAAVMVVIYAVKAHFLAALQGEVEHLIAIRAKGLAFLGQVGRLTLGTCTKRRISSTISSLCASIQARTCFKNSGSTFGIPKTFLSPGAGAPSLQLSVYTPRRPFS